MTYWHWFLGLAAVAPVIAFAAGWLPVLGPFAAIISAALVPFVDGVARFVVYALTSVAKGVRISLSNITAFWILYPLVFISGGIYFGYADPFKAGELKSELRTVKAEHVKVSKEAATLRKKYEPTKGKSLTPAKPVEQPKHAEFKPQFPFGNPFSF